jgi:serine/threonine-protein kinase
VVRQSGADHRIDIFAVGIVMWEMLAGRRLFLGGTDVETLQMVARCIVPPLGKYNPRCPREVERLVARLLIREPDRRIGSAAELLNELDPLIAHVDSGVGPKDVALLVGLHLATSEAERPQAMPDVADLLAQELDAFAQAAGGHRETGASPLDPSEFESTMRSGVRPHPEPDDD